MLPHIKCSNINRKKKQTNKILTLNGDFLTKKKTGINNENRLLLVIQASVAAKCSEIIFFTPFLLFVNLEMKKLFGN